MLWYLKQRHGMDEETWLKSMYMQPHNQYSWEWNTENIGRICFLLRKIDSNSERAEQNLNSN